VLNKNKKAEQDHKVRTTKCPGWTSFRFVSPLLPPSPRLATEEGMAPIINSGREPVAIKKLLFFLSLFI